MVRVIHRALGPDLKYVQLYPIIHLARHTESIRFFINLGIQISVIYFYIAQTVQHMEEERIRFLRGNMWSFTNINTLQCVHDDEVSAGDDTNKQTNKQTNELPTASKHPPTNKQTPTNKEHTDKHTNRQINFSVFTGIYHFLPSSPILQISHTHIAITLTPYYFFWERQGDNLGSSPRI